MIVPRWVIVAFAVSTIAAFLVDQGRALLDAGHVPNPTLTGLLGTMFGGCLLLVKGAKSDAQGTPPAPPQPPAGHAPPEPESTRNGA